MDLRTPGIFLLKAAGTAAAGALPICCFLRMFRAQSQIDVVCGGIYLLMSLYVFGLFCAICYSGGAANALTDFLLYPRRYLKKKPPILSRQLGLIASHRFEEAESELMELSSRYPGSPEITLMLAELHEEQFKDLEAAIADCRAYFLRRSWRYHEFNLKIVLKYADLLQELGRISEAKEKLQKELRASFYPDGEKKALTARLHYLSQGEQSSEE